MKVNIDNLSEKEIDQMIEKETIFNRAMKIADLLKNEDNGIIQPILNKTMDILKLQNI